VAPESSLPAARLQDLRHADGAIEALRSVDLGFSGRKVTAVVGTSGSGKSTLLRALAGSTARRRRAVVGGRDLRTASAGELRATGAPELRRAGVG
jgi:ABC-type branched-subunit amino acid transport system ATPase component